MPFSVLSEYAGQLECEEQDTLPKQSDANNNTEPKTFILSSFKIISLNFPCHQK